MCYILQNEKQKKIQVDVKKKKRMELILRWHFPNLGHPDDKEEIIISSLVLFLTFPLKTIYGGNDSDGPD